MDAETHRLAQRVQKARRNAARARRRANPILRWRPQREHRCLACGRWVGLGAEAGHTGPVVFCEPCVLAREIRVASLRALGMARTVVASGAA